MKGKSFWESIAGKRLLFLFMIIAVILLNYITGLFTNYMKIPFFLDTWGTSLGVMAGGLGIGVIGGVLYNLVMAFTVWGPAHWVWAFVNIWVALATYFFWKREWINIKRPGKLLLAGLIIGLTEAVVVIMILFSAFGGVDVYEGTIPTYDALLESTGSKTIAAIGEKLITIPIDQIIALFIAAIVFSTLPEKYKLTKSRG